MQPPWEVEPEKFVDKFWIVAKSDYLGRWHNWFRGLSEDEQKDYEKLYPEPAVCDGNFYYLSAIPPYDPVAFADQYRDKQGYLPPPWIAFPDIGLGSIGWRMGHGEDYWHVFHEWFVAMPEKEKNAFKAKYPEPAEVEHGLPWTGFYERKEHNV